MKRRFNVILSIAILFFVSVSMAKKGEPKKQQNQEKVESVDQETKKKDKKDSSKYTPTEQELYKNYEVVLCYAQWDAVYRRYMPSISAVDKNRRIRIQVKVTKNSQGKPEYKFSVHGEFLDLNPPLMKSVVDDSFELKNSGRVVRSIDGTYESSVNEKKGMFTFTDYGVMNGEERAEYYRNHWGYGQYLVTYSVPQYTSLDFIDSNYTSCEEK